MLHSTEYKENHERTPVGIAGVSAEIWTKHLLQISLEQYC
jgi:hypothetical protein